MEDAILLELEELRAENKILRDSLTEYRPESADDGAAVFEKMFHDLSGAFGAAAGKAKESLNPATEKLTEALSRQMEENPVPMLLAAFGAGFLFSRSLERK